MSTPKDLGCDKQNTLADPKAHKPDLGRAVTTLAEDVQKVMASLYDLQKSLDGTSNPSFTNVRKVLKDQWHPLRSYLQQCHGFGADVLTLKDALRNLNEGDLIEFLDEMATSAKELRKWSEDLKNIDMSSAFSEENQSDESVKFLPAKGKRNVISKTFIAAFGGAEKHKFRSKIYRAMLRIESNTKIIFQFWDDTFKRCSSLLEEYKNGGVHMTNVEAEQIISNWKGYQEAILKAIASIAMTCDAILVEAEGVPTIGLAIVPPISGERNGTARRKRFGLRPIGFHKGRSRGDRNGVATSRAQPTDYKPPPPTTTSTTPPTTSTTLPPSTTTIASRETPIQEGPTRSAQTRLDIILVVVKMGAASRVAASRAEPSRVADFSSFSLPSPSSTCTRPSSTCTRLTHLSFSAFHPPDSGQDQTLDLPVLNALILNFFSQDNTIPPLVQPTHVHHYYRDRRLRNLWNLPNLRNLSLKGQISDANPNFLGQINGILRAVGPTLQGLLYNLRILSETGVCIPHPLPSSLWDWCPHLHTIQTALEILLVAPMPPPSHPRLTFVSVHVKDLDTFPDNKGNLVWPEDQFQDARSATSWPIDITRISMKWGTFHRKRQGMPGRSANPDQQGRINRDPSKWPGYVCDLANTPLGKRHALQDRNGVDVSQGDDRVLVLWLRSIDEWSSVP